MDAILGNPTNIFIIAVAVIIVVVAFIFRQKIRLFFKGPGGTELNLDASNQRAPTPPGAVVKGSKSRKGGILAKSTNGGGAIQHIFAINQSSNTPPKP